MSNIFKKLQTDNVIYIFIFVTFYILNSLSPLAGDDYWYSLVMSNGFYSDVCYRPINNLADIVDSQIWAYNYHNGRFIIHSVVQLFCGIIGLKIFQIINSIVFVLLIIGITRIVRLKYNSVPALDIFIPFMMIFFTIPKIGLTYLGNVSFSVNYLWTSCVVVWYIYLLFILDKASILKTILLLIFSIIAGSLQESFSIGLSFVLGVYLLVHIKQIKQIQLYMILGFCAGAIICICAPSNFLRFMNSEGGSFHLNGLLLQCIRVALSLRMFYLAFIVVCLSWYYLKKKQRSLSVEYWWMLGICFVNIIFASIVAMTGKHQLVSIELFSILIIVCILYDWYAHILKKYTKKILMCLLFLYMILYIPIFYYRWVVNDGYQSLIEQSIKNSNGVVVADKYEYGRTIYNWFTERYTMQENYGEWNRNGLSLYLTRGVNINYISSIIPESETSIVSNCVPENAVGNGVYKSSESSYYVLKFPIENKHIRYCTKLKPGIIGGCLYHIIYGKAQYYDESIGWARDCNSFDFEGYTYAIVQDASQIHSVALIQVD